MLCTDPRSRCSTFGHRLTNLRKAFPWLAGAALGGFGWLIYGTLVEANKLVVERRKLRLPNWPKERDGYRIALLADLHVRDEYSIAHTKRAIKLALESEPDIIAIAGDFVGYWKADSPWQLEEALSDLEPMRGRIVAVPGNHDYWDGHAGFLQEICAVLGIELLRNQTTEIDGVTWVGVDSGNEGYADPIEAMKGVEEGKPTLCLWHEPDFVDGLPPGAALMLSGHSHGGQWRFPWGWTPMHTKGGTRYVDGFYPEASTPLYVSRGVGTTGPPARMGVLAEVAILELYHG